MTNEKAREVLQEQIDRYGEEYDAEEGIEALEMAIKALEQQPKTGHWIEEEVFDGEVAYKCSKCGGLFVLENGNPKENEYNFCPKCGARMVESEGEE